MKVSKILFAVGITLTGACKMKSDHSKLDEVSAASTNAPAPDLEEKPQDEPSGGVGTSMALDEGKMGKKESERAEGQYKMMKNADVALARNGDDAKAPAAAKPDPAGGKGGGPGGGDGEAAVTRAWFPETFLWQPLVVTDDQGAATVPVRVPDRLTTWHVLALAHTRNGAQGGAVTSFLGTLPAYVDVVVPPFLIVGDQIRLPIQLVNTTATPIASALTVEAAHATLAPIGGARTIPAAGSLVEYATLTATSAGQIKLTARLGSTDAVIRTIDVLPAGKPVVTNRSGTLAAPRTLSITGPANSDPSTDRARLVVYPGALALLRSELGVSPNRPGVADHAYALLLAGRAPALLAALGDQADPDAIRNLTILTGTTR
ncbi:MAG: hypothetical protein NT062_07430 [Proteobacteria bacterium]|nr:hypothetical protein [Pseudomonadota bacterium]